MRFEQWRFPGQNLAEPNKLIDESFGDWESEAFGLGYGTGERPVLTALKSFMGSVGTENGPHCYDYEILERALTASVAWLLINRLCQVGVLEYGSSPRFGWLSEEGVALKNYMDSKTVDYLVDVCCADRVENGPCYSDACNCGPDGHDEKRVCYNPFWPHHHL